MKIKVAKVHRYAKYAPGSGLGAAVYSIPALGGHLGVYFINEEDDRLNHILTVCVDRVAEAIVDEIVERIKDGEIDADNFIDFKYSDPKGA